MSTLPRTVVYDDEELRAVWQEGRSDWLLVTFGDLNNLASDDNFFAASAVRRLEISCLGISAKGPNAYPAANMAALYSTVQNLLASFPHRVLYGGSMGGYASIKFSRLLGARTVIAFCPQSGIDPNECPGFDPGWSNIFTPAMVGHGIRSADVAGDVWLFSDPYTPVERAHRELIVKQCASSFSVNVHNCGHDVTSVLAGSENMDLLIKCCGARDISGVVRLVGDIRRQHPLRKALVARLLAERHPLLAARILSKRPAGDSIFSLLTVQHFEKVLYALQLRQDAAAIDAWTSIAGEVLPSLNALLLISNLHQKKCEEMRVGIVTCHKTVLMFNPVKGVCEHCLPPDRDDWPSHYVPVKMRMAGNQVQLYVAAAFGEVVFGIDTSGHIVPLSLDNVAATERFELTHNGKGRFALSWNGLFLSAEPSGSLMCNRTLALVWETFSFF